MTLSFSAVEAQPAKVKTWSISESQGGGFAGNSKSYTLDSTGDLRRMTRTGENFEKIDEKKIAEIGRLVAALKLPGTKLKTVKGVRIYDGIFTSFVINLDGKAYKIEGTSFDDAKYIDLSAKQKATLEKLKEKLGELKVFLPDAMTN
jgi:hypothetical protein